MTSKRRRWTPRQSGMATVWVAVIVMLLIGLVGLGVDTGYVLLGAHQLQNAADAAALAAAMDVRSDQNAARVAAINCALANVAAGETVHLAGNDGNLAGGDIVFGLYDRESLLFTPTTESPNAVQVVARRASSSFGGRMPLIFGRIFGVEGVDVARGAIAMIGGSVDAGVIALDLDASRAIWVNGNATIQLTSGGVYVNSSHGEAVRANGNPLIDAAELNVVGDANLGGGDFTGELVTGVAVADDPLASLPAVDYSGMADKGGVKAKKGQTVLDPGYYSGGIRAAGGDVTLNPGLYVLDGVGLDLSGKGDVTAEGVLLHIVGSGAIDLTGKGRITISPPDPETHFFVGAETYAGISIFQARGNSSESKITGNGQLALAGTLYVPAAHVKIAGNGDTFGNQLICNTLKVSGNGGITIDYDGRFPLEGNRVFLVE